jgi:hypothetical protein
MDDILSCRNASTIFAYEVTSKAVMLKVCTCVKWLWLLEKFGLWYYVEQENIVTMTTTIDGGELMRPLTQMSGCIKIYDPRAIDPRTGSCLLSVAVRTCSHGITVFHCMYI